MNADLNCRVIQSASGGKLVQYCQLETFAHCKKNESNERRSVLSSRELSQCDSQLNTTFSTIQETAEHYTIFWARKTAR